MKLRSIIDSGAYKKGRKASKKFREGLEAGDTKKSDKALKKMKKHADRTSKAFQKEIKKLER